MVKTSTFQHNGHVLVTKESYQYVTKVRRALLINITRLLNDLKIRFVISHGNLIEFIRKRRLFHDDDLDIRFCIHDFPKWLAFAGRNKTQTFHNYNLSFDEIILQSSREQRVRGVKAWLINPPKRPTFIPKMDIHIDLVPSIVTHSFWMNYKISWNKLRLVQFLGVKTWAPRKKDCKKVLKKQYGKDFMRPNFKRYRVLSHKKSRKLYRRGELRILNSRRQGSSKVVSNLAAFF